ncbi:MAG TPA: ECF-type sigma factor [Thermoanaerobaculia bacterium]
MKTETLTEMLPAVYDELRRLARLQRRRLAPGQTLETTALVHEAYLKLSVRPGWNDDNHFYSSAARAMRQILVDYARQRTSLKRGGGEAASALEEGRTADHQAVQTLALDLALRDLAAVDERLVRVVECRVFAGYSEEETAQALSTSLRTVQRDWVRARAWLRDAITPGATP